MAHTSSRSIEHTGTEARVVPVYDEGNKLSEDEDSIPNDDKSLSKEEHSIPDD